MDAISQIVIIGSHEGIAKVPRVFSKDIVGDIKTECAEVFDKKHRRSPGVPLAEHMDLPQSGYKQREVMDDLIH